MASQAKQKHTETMEEVLNSLKHACELAKKIESELPNMADQPDMLSSSIDDVVKAFMAAKERLLMMMVVPQQDQAMAGPSFAPMLTHEAMQMGASSMQEWFRSSSYAHTMDQLLMQMQQQPFDASALMGGVDLQQLRHRSTLRIGETGARDVEGSEKSKGSEGEAQGVEASPSRPRKRKSDAEKITKLFPAPQVGNTEMPPEDGFTWRKYGQKEILGSKYPRSYYRCTHQKLYACPAKKQVQRLDHNPNIFEVTYGGEHTCHMSSTAPSSFPPQPLVDIPKDMAQSTTSSQLSPSSTSVSRWLQSSVNLSLGGGSGMAPAGGGDGSGARPSTSKYGTDYLVAEMADAMFNSGSSSGNCSMESLFHPPEDKWDPGEKKS